MIQYVFSGAVDGGEGSVTFYANGEMHTVSSDSPSFEEIKEALIHQTPEFGVSADALVRLAAPVTAVIEAIEALGNRVPAGTVEVDYSGVKFNGVPVHGVLVDRIVEIARAFGNIAPWVAFMENLFQNPSYTSRQELYLWLEKGKLPLTEDGHFLAFKKVRGDFKDGYTGTLDYSPGQVVTMARYLVDDNRDNTCSVGLHFCSAEYLPSYGCGNNERVVLVKINPADVVSIPSDYNNTKGRAWRIEVLEDVTATYGHTLWSSVYDYSPDDYFDDNEWFVEGEDADAFEDYAAEHGLAAAREVWGLEDEADTSIFGSNAARIAAPADGWSPLEEALASALTGAFAAFEDDPSLEDLFNPYDQGI